MERNEEGRGEEMRGRIKNPGALTTYIHTYTTRQGGPRWRRKKEEEKDKREEDEAVGATSTSIHPSTHIHPHPCTSIHPQPRRHSPRLEDGEYEGDYGNDVQTNQRLCQQAFTHKPTGENVYNINPTACPCRLPHSSRSRSGLPGHVSRDVSPTLAPRACQRPGLGNSVVHSTALDLPAGRSTRPVLDAPTPAVFSRGSPRRVLNNTTNELTGPIVKIPLVRKWGHP